MIFLFQYAYENLGKIIIPLFVLAGVDGELRLVRGGEKNIETMIPKDMKLPTMMRFC